MNTLKNILYVEDEDIAFQVVKKFLENLYTVEIAENAEKAIQMLKNNKYDLILMDISLRRSISGIDLTRIIRTMPEYMNVPILAVTAHAMVGDKEAILNSGCDAYLSKPFSRKELIDQIIELLNK